MSDVGLCKHCDATSIKRSGECGAGRLDHEFVYSPPDVVNHPAHYLAHPSGVECIAITEHFNFNVGNAIKYLWRAGLKGEADEDLKKARWYIEREIQRREGSR